MPHRRCGGRGGPGRAGPRPRRCRRRRPARPARRGRRERPRPAGRRRASPLAGARRAGDADVVGDEVRGPLHGGPGAAAFGPSVTSGRWPPAVRASSSPIAALAADSLITGSRPLGMPDRSTAQVEVAVGERDPEGAASSPWGASSSKECVTPSRRCSGLGTTRPAHTTSWESVRRRAGWCPHPRWCGWWRPAASRRGTRGRRRSRPRTGRAGRRPARPWR